MTLLCMQVSMNSSRSFFPLLLAIWFYGTLTCGDHADTDPPEQELYYGYNMAAEFLIPQNNARADLGLPPLQWDGNLVNYAQWWANQREYYGRCQLQHSGGPYGENIFWGSSGRNWSPADAVDSWVTEREWYNYYSNTCLYDNRCGHYTQIVWRNTRFVGCARVTCSDGDVFITCNYYPPGNYVGQRPY